MSSIKGTLNPGLWLGNEIIGKLQRNAPPLRRAVFTISAMKAQSHSSSPEHAGTRTEIESVSSEPMKYVIALGSNMGDRFDWIEQACREMEAAGIRIYATSGLFQTTAMYVENQDDFLNGVCMIETALQPLVLMKTLQGIEKKLGRVKVVDKGPRNIDLDILLWEKGGFHSADPDLSIPHKLMGERDFVLAPLCQ